MIRESTCEKKQFHTILEFLMVIAVSEADEKFLRVGHFMMLMMTSSEDFETRYFYLISFNSQPLII